MLRSTMARPLANYKRMLYVSEISMKLHCEFAIAMWNG